MGIIGLAAEPDLPYILVENLIFALATNALTFPGLACYKLLDRPRLIALMPSLLGERENE
jgi:hypothetical protein